MIKGGLAISKYLVGLTIGALNPEKRHFVAEQLNHSIRSIRQRYHDPFVFIHINKTGGSSISRALGIERQHMPAFCVRNLIGETAWQSKFKFSIVRNPWDRVVSQYHYRLQANQQNIQEQKLSFNDWVKAVYRDQSVDLINSYAMFMPQWYWLSDMDGKLIIDYIARFEMLERDIDYVLKKLNINGSIQHLRKSNRNHYREYFNNETVDIIAKWFDKDINHFGYSYE